MNRATSEQVAAFCHTEGYGYQALWRDPPFSGVLFRSRKSVLLRDVVDARGSQNPFLLGRLRGRHRRELAVLVLPLGRPVPNLVLAAARTSTLPGQGIAFVQSQRLHLEGDFQKYFSLYCPSGYERDALWIFTPDLMELFIDAPGARDLEFVDDRLLLYAPASQFYGRDQLAVAATLAAFFRERLERQTVRYRDEDRVGTNHRDPFRQALLTSASSEGFAVGNDGRRVQYRQTGWQRVAQGSAVALAIAAGAYWVAMVAFSLFGFG